MLTVCGVIMVALGIFAIFKTKGEYALWGIACALVGAFVAAMPFMS